MRAPEKSLLLKNIVLSLCIKYGFPSKTVYWWFAYFLVSPSLLCTMNHFLRIDVAGNKGVVAIEPEGLSSLLLDLKGYISKAGDS